MFKYVFLSILFLFVNSIPIYCIEYNEENPHPELVAAIKTFDKEKVREVLSRIPKFTSEREWWNYISLVSDAEGRKTNSYRDNLAQISGWSGVLTRLEAIQYPLFWFMSRRCLVLKDMSIGWLEGVTKDEAPKCYYFHKGALSVLLGTAAFTAVTTLLYEYYVNKSEKANAICDLLSNHKN